MMAWTLLASAILVEVGGTLALRVAAHGRHSFYAIVVPCYVTSLVLLSGALAAGVDLGVAYGIWSACGVALTALASWLLFRERLSPVMLTGIGLIIVGVLLVDLGAAH